MPSLFIDTTDNVVVGVLSDQYKFLEIKNIGNRKSSKEIHGIIYESLKKHGLELSNINSLFLISGPGSYTGMRVGEGIAQIVEWQSIPTYSFYHFQIPFFLGKLSGTWISNAFKSEYYMYSWNKNENKSILIKEEDIEKKIKDLKAKNENIYVKFKDSIKHSNDKYIETSSMIVNFDSKLFLEVIKQKKREEPYYYRSLEKEFKKSKESSSSEMR